MSQRPLIGIAVDAVMGHGRSILRGAMRYANVRRKWLIHEELRITGEELPDWPRCDGVLIAASNCPLETQVLRSSPFVVNCTGGADPSMMSVVRSDDVAVGRMAADHLMDCRLTHFGFYGRSSPSLVSDDRFAGFAAALSEKGFQCRRSPVYWPASYSWTARNHWPGLISWLRSAPKPIGILAVDDTAAHDLAAVCLEAKLGVPDRVAIIGVNNDDLLCDSAWPPLSSVATEPARLGYEAARLLDRLLCGEKIPPQERVTRLMPIGVARRVSTDVLAIEDPNVAEAVRYIREHACDPCSVADVLKSVPVNRRWLERNFATHLGHSLHNEMIRVRIEAARQMLLKSDARLPEIAETCGFGTVQTFSRLFLQHTGSTPAAWRRTSQMSQNALT